jgi:signal transduction histidine kinase
VLSNILTNALKFTETGEIVVRVYLANDSQWGVEVRDTGPGMPSEIIAHIFDPFWQGDGSITREYRGVGLGLSIAKQLTHMMSGNIDVESTVGKGSIFRVLLPTQITGGVKREKEISGTDH